MMVVPSIVLCGAYLVGAIPTGYWFTKYFFAIDIRTVGSGNSGATNVARVLGNVNYFYLIFAIDFLKAFLYLLLASYWWEFGVWQNYIGALLLFGNGCSVFMSFHGGKGVATAFGTLPILYSWIFFLVALTLWIVLRKKFGQSGMASVVTFSCLLFMLRTWYLFFLALWIIWRHLKNIQMFYSGLWRSDGV